MHFTTLILSTGLALALAPAGALAWAQSAENGVWVANNVWYGRVGNYNNVHESCTRRLSQIVLTSGSCTYWTNGQGGLGHGFCEVQNNKVACEPGCPDPFSPCQFELDDGDCEIGYVGCLQKMSCSNNPGSADCIGTATGCRVCK